jgi:hypothetical protein
MHFNRPPDYFFSDKRKRRFLDTIVIVDVWVGLCIFAQVIALFRQVMMISFRHFVAIEGMHILGLLSQPRHPELGSHHVLTCNSLSYTRLLL